MKHVIRTKLLLFFFLLLSRVSSAQHYIKDFTFAPLVAKSNGGSVSQIIVQPDQKILLNPGATYINGIPVRGLARLNPDGSLDSTFRKGLNEDYSSVALRPDGKILGMNLHPSGADKIQFELRLYARTGDLDSTYSSELPYSYPFGGMFALQKNGTILAVANLLDNGTATAKIFRLSSRGRVEATYDLPFLKVTWVTGIVPQPDGKALILGSFSDDATQVPRTMIRLNADGTLDAGFGLSPHLSVRTAALQPDGKILAARNLGPGSLGPEGIVRLNPDGTQDLSFQVPASGVSTNATTLALLPNGQVLASVMYQDPRYPADRHQVVRFNADGSLDGAFAAAEGADRYISTLALQQDGSILAGGMFMLYEGQVRAGLVRLGSTGAYDPDFKAKMEYSGHIGAIARQSDGKILVGGTFNIIGERAQNRLARMLPDGTLDAAFNTGSGAGQAISTQDADIRAVAVQADGKILAGGNFTRFNGQTTTGLVRLNADGSISDVFAISAEPGYTVEAIVVQPDQKILVGGFIPNTNDTHKLLVRLLPDGRPDPGFSIGTGFRGSVDAVVLQPDGKILVGGPFTHFNDVPAERIVRLNADGTRDATFSLVPTGIAVRQVVLQPDGKILIEGSYNSLIISPYSSYIASKAARLHADGRVDSTFKLTLGIHDYIEHITVRPNGQILLAGTFHSPRRVLMMLNADGSVNPFVQSFLLEDVIGITQVLPEGKDLFAVAYDRLFRINRYSAQSITFDSIPDKVVTDTPFTLSARSNRNLPVTYTVVSGPASVTGNVVTLAGTPGMVFIRASQAGNDDVDAALDVKKMFRVESVLGLAAAPAGVKVHPNPSSGLFVVTLPAPGQVKDIRLLNALYLKGAWISPFDPALRTDGRLRYLTDASRYLITTGRRDGR
ncbi:MAG: hypothetical protein ICV83_19735, partial [Cytophagales bacterium]|nr:hypothetical protein [Cytophagales bacterium]